MILNIDNVIKEFIAEAKFVNKPDWNYKNQLEIFADWLDGNGIIKPTTTNIKTYKIQLAESGLSELYVNRILVLITVFFSWMSKKGYADDVTDGIIAPYGNYRPTKRLLSWTQLLTLVESIGGCGSEIQARDNALILLLLQTGLFLSDIANLTIGDFCTVGTRGLFIISTNPLLQDQFITPDEPILNNLYNYSKTYRSRNLSSPLFTSTTENERPLSEKSISAIIKGRLNIIGLTQNCFSSISLRYPLPGHLLKTGHSISQVEAFMRYKTANLEDMYPIKPEIVSQN